MNSIEVTKEAIENKFTNAVDYFGLYIPNLLSFYALFTKRVNNNIKSMRICVKTDVTPYLEYNEEWVCSIDKSVFVFVMASSSSSNFTFSRLPCDETIENGLPLRNV